MRFDQPHNEVLKIPVELTVYFDIKFLQRFQLALTTVIWHGHARILQNLVKTWTAVTTLVLSKEPRHTEQEERDTT